MKEKPILGIDKGEAPVDEVAQVRQQLPIVFGCQVAPLEVCVG